MSGAAFDTINVKLVASSAGFDGGLDKGIDKLKGFAGKAKGVLEKGGDLFSGGFGEGLAGAFQGILGAAGSLGGPLGLAITAASTAFTAIKGIHDLTKDKSTEDDAEKKKIEAEKNKQELEAAKIRGLQRRADEALAPVRAIAQLNEALTKQIMLFGKSSDEAALFSAKLDLVTKGGIAAKHVFGEREPVIDVRGIRFNRREIPALRALDEAEFRAELKRDQQTRASIQASNRSPFDEFGDNFSEAKRLKDIGRLSRADFGKRVAGLAEGLERAFPDPSGALARATTAGSPEAASFLLRAERQAAVEAKPAFERLQGAIDRARAVEESQLAVQEELLKVIEKNGGLAIANF